jgi:hypothetical protein
MGMPEDYVTRITQSPGFVACRDHNAMLSDIKASKDLFRPFVVLA